MDDQLGPWLVVGGFVVAFGLLWVGSRWDGRRPAGAAVAYGLAGIAFSETTLFWLSTGTGSAVPDLLWFAFPLLITILVAWRGYRQRTWIRRVGGNTMPTFGVFPVGGLAVGYDAADREAVAATAEFDHFGHRLLGVQYTLGGPPEKEKGFQELAKVAQLVDGTYTMVELRTPVVPSLVIRPNTAAFEPERFTPLENARITRNTFGILRPDALLRELDPVDRAFTVTAADPEFARSVLTDDIVALLTTDPWFRVRQIAFHNGSLYSTESGSLTEERMYHGARQLARLAALVPWEDAEFRAQAVAADTTDGDDTSLRGKVNRRRDKAGRQPVSALSLFVRTTMTLVFLLAGLSLAVNSTAVLAGLAPEVKVTVTQSYGGPDINRCQGCHNEDAIDGEYCC